MIIREHHRALFFDFDGVIVDSVEVKTRAFATVFAPYGEAAQKTMVAYHTAHHGVSRYEKFRYFATTVLGRKADDALLGELDRRMRAVVVDEVVKAPYIQGALSFVERQSRLRPCYVVSATPREELEEIIRRRGIADLFRGLRGSPKSKSENLRELLAICGAKPNEGIMFGDAEADLTAATELGLEFVGVNRPGGAFVITDFTDPRLAP